MQTEKALGRPRFSQAARDAARRAKQAKALMQVDITAPEVFVVRRTSLPDPFAWEIRRFGGVFLCQSEAGFASITLARAAGRQALAGMLSP